MEIGGYTMDLYCRYSEVDTDKIDTVHSLREFPHEFYGETRGVCAKEARERGWVFNRDGNVTCPKCAKKRHQKTSKLYGQKRDKTRLTKNQLTTNQLKNNKMSDPSPTF